MKKPLIGLVPLVDEGRESYWMLPGYMTGVEQAGGVPVMLPLTSDREALRRLAEGLDGFLLTGGHDVSPAVYGAPVSPLCGACCPGRDAMEGLLLRLALEKDKPVLGICRGIQFLNAALGGTLYQDLPAERPSEVVHHQEPPYDQPSHPVAPLPGTPLEKLMGAGALPVNSCHHQGLKDLAPGLSPMATAEDGLVEAVWMPGARFVWAVQWHPEFAFRTEASRRIFGTFVAACE
ncbi:MAG: gamma-glutamyl-gamma-aminobutyrate hydrolase family protein [Oscillospiraceae bacterium]|jgi:putative glutamine amidotransferase|nr:gamma-glutamyl-gamma-aminobutyrate hydrolase family protein [Oscillospiraceae bacterium]